MNLEQLKQLKRNDVLYNKETQAIVIVGNRDPKAESEAGTVSIRAYNGGQTLTPIKEDEAPNWELVDDNSPDGIKLQIVLMRLTMLEEFVFNRLK